MEEELPSTESRPSSSLTRELMERVRALERSVQRMQFDQKERDEWHAQHIHSLERQLSSSASLPSSCSLSSASSSLPSSPTTSLQRSPRLAYSSSFKKPEVPSVFQMPVHYPSYSKADYDSMPEWKLDRLLEEYGLPVKGSLPEKRQYAMGVFLWN
ncbi:hypothetical protein GOP47_0020343 [Adiantum capillus-veneris]|uniref:DUF7722 domain-containing protein n=1 Tax=Adiantum capillus-veneris TaxID=13818 RepID=A0A9D4Z7Y6_ADICA|nr:hypothetical protein GOP47_0020343 [Adiantum capillus-veneris]